MTIFSARRAAVAVLGFATLVAAATPSFPYGSTKIRGINLGGWLVLEPWITPSLFDNASNDAIVDEWTFGAYQDRAVARSVLQKHWDTWITETDFAEIAAAGLNHVRLPVGFWAWDVSGGEPYVQGQLPYVRKAIGWARKHGLKVVLDLHGAAGSQNGFDNSGHRVDPPAWHTDPHNVARTNAVMRRIVDEFGAQPDVVSVIEPLNEPAAYKDPRILPVVQQYYRDSYGTVRYPSSPSSSSESSTLLLLHDAFQDPSVWHDFPATLASGPNSNRNVAFDTHIYQVFSDAENARSEAEHVADACANVGRLAQFPESALVVVGEWTPAMTDCARYLNGRGVGARYDGSFPSSHAVGSCTSKTGPTVSSADYARFLGKMWAAQVYAFERGGAGWFMWTWKTEEAAEWAYKAGLEGGWIRRDIDGAVKEGEGIPYLYRTRSTLRHTILNKSSVTVRMPG